MNERLIIFEEVKKKIEEKKQKATQDAHKHYVAKFTKENAIKLVNTYRGLCCQLEHGRQKMKAIILSIALIFIIGLNAFAQTDDYSIGKAHGEQMAKGNPLWLLAGFGCSSVGVGFAYYIYDPKIDYKMILDKSSSYQAGYVHGYQNKVRIKNTVYASIGWFTSLAICYSLLIYFDTSI